MYLEDRSR